MAKQHQTPLKLVSNSPVIDEKKYGVYADVLHDKIQDKNVYNIGVIGSYGAGKSSLIKTYQHKYRKKLPSQDTKMTTISLANFNDTKKQEEMKPTNEEHGGIKDIDCAVEKSILEQFLYKVGKNKVPYSKIRRINTNHGWRSFRLAFYLIATIAFIGCAVLEFFNLLPKSDGSHFYIYAGAAVVTTLCFLYLLLYSNKINKIAVRDVQTEFCESNTGSILNTFIDEIIYYFQTTKLEVVVIEDLDRFNNTSIFSKLRELNFLINNSQLVKQKVTFIYAIKDDLFQTQSDRAKFFDYILSLIPILSFTNARELLKNELNSVCSKEMKLPEIYIHEISHFITEMRVLKNIINDYVTYYYLLEVSQFSDVKKNIKLFSLMIYKNLYPSDFAQLQYGKGELADIFENKAQYISDLIKRKEEEIKNLTNKKIEAQKEAVDSFELLRKAVIGCLVSRNQTGYSYMNGVDVSNVKSFQGIAGRIAYYGNSYWYADMRQIDETLGEKVVDVEQRIRNKSEEEQKQMQLQIDTLQQQIRQSRNYTLSEYLATKNVIEIKDDLQRFLLLNGYIDETYKDYVARIEQGFMSVQDREFIKRVLTKQPIDALQQLDKSELVVREISQERFSDRYVFNYSLIAETLKEKTNDRDVIEKQKILRRYLTSRNPETIDFWKNYLNDQQDVEFLFGNIFPVYDCFCLDIFSNATTVVEQKDQLLSALFKRGDIDLLVKQNQENVLTEYLSGHSNAIDAFAFVNANTDLFAEVLRRLNVKLKIVTHSQTREDMLAQYIMEGLINNNLYVANFKNLEFILRSHYGFEDCKKALFSCVLQINNLGFIAYIESKHQALIDEYDCGVNMREEEQLGIEWVLNNKILALDVRKKFVSNLKSAFNVYDGIEKELLAYAYEQNKILPTWKNIVETQNEHGLALQAILSYIEQNAQELATCPLENKETELWLCNKASFTNLGEFEIYSKAFAVPLKVSEITKEEIAVILVNNGVIEANAENLFMARSKMKVLVSILLKNPTVIDEVDASTFGMDIITGLLTNQDFTNDIKSRLIYKVQSGYTPPNDAIKESVGKIILKSKIESCCERLLDILISGNIDSQIKIKLLDVYGGDIDKSKFFNYLKKAVPKVASLETQQEHLLPRKEYDEKIFDMLARKNIFKVTKYKYRVRLVKIS